MRTLAIDCATEACSVALFEGTELIAGDLRLLGRGHAEHLLPMIAALPSRGRSARIAVDLGPGSFTGIRVGLAAARALALAWGAGIVGYGATRLLAAMAAATHPGEAVDVAMTGGHGEWFFQPFAPDGSPHEPVRSIPPPEAVAAARASIAIGSQAEALVAGRGWGAAIAAWPDARRFALVPAAGLTGDALPIYGRPADARLPSAA